MLRKESASVGVQLRTRESVSGRYKSLVDADVVKFPPKTVFS